MGIELAITDPEFGVTRQTIDLSPVRALRDGVPVNRDTLAKLNNSFQSDLMVAITAINDLIARGLGEQVKTVGTTGTTLRSGLGAPASTLGVNGDYYLNIDPTSGTGDLYQRSADTYTVVMNLKGAKGTTGLQPWQIPPVPWATNTSYVAIAPASTVNYQGSSYICSISHTSTSTFDATKFVMLAAKGDPGTAGTGSGTGSSSGLDDGVYDDPNYQPSAPTSSTQNIDDGTY